MYLCMYLFLERGREEEKHQCVLASHMPPTGDLTRSPGMCSDWELNQRLFGSQAGTESTEPYQPGLFLSYNAAVALLSVGFMWVH